jgi:pyruvate ferredoxin oxidoreductase alpha subunit
MQALDVIPQLADEFAGEFGRESGGLISEYRTEDAETIVVALGSVLGTIEDVVDELREGGHKIGALGIKCFRPYPLEEVREALCRTERIVVLEKAFAVGAGGIVGQNVRLALSGLVSQVYDVVAGLGGRPITKQSLHALFADLDAGRLEVGRLTFLDLDRERVERELERMRVGGRTGPHAENIIRDLGIVAARSH